MCVHVCLRRVKCGDYGMVIIGLFIEYNNKTTNENEKIISDNNK